MLKWKKISSSDIYKKVLQNGKKIVKDSFVVYVLKKSEYSGIGIIASKKVGGAVQRNRCKRLLRACFNEINKCENAMVFIARKGLLQITYNVLLKEVSAVIS